MTEKLKTLRDLEFYRPMSKKVIEEELKNIKLTEEEIKQKIIDYTKDPLAHFNKLLFDKEDMVPICANEIRAAARDWVERLKLLNSYCFICKNSIFHDKEKGCGHSGDKVLYGEIDGDDSENEGVIKWMKHFFNLEEEKE